MLGGMEMCAGVAILRRVAAAHVAALQAHAQVNPRVAHLEALLAAFGLRLYLFQVVGNVCAGCRHHALRFYYAIPTCTSKLPDTAGPVHETPSPGSMSKLHRVPVQLPAVLPPARPWQPQQCHSGTPRSGRR